MSLADGYQARPADEQFGEISDGRVSYTVVPPDDPAVPTSLTDVFVSLGPFADGASDDGLRSDIDTAISKYQSEQVPLFVDAGFTNAAQCRASIQFLVGGAESDFYERPWIIAVNS